MKHIIAVLLLLLCTSTAFGATCKISEYRLLARDANDQVSTVGLEPAVTTQTVTYTVSAQSAAFNELTSLIRVICDAKAHFLISTAGTNATADSPFVPANVAEYFGVQIGRDDIIDFYDGTT